MGAVGRRRRTVFAIALLGGALAIAYRELPALATWKLRRELAALGFDSPRFRVDHAGIDRLELAEVELAPGLQLGSVEIDGGLSLLWRDPDVVSITGARIGADVLAGIQARGTFDDVPAIREVRIANSVLEVPGGELAVNGRVTLDGPPRAYLTASAGRWSYANQSARDVRIDVVGEHACASATVREASVVMCARPSWTSGDVAWRAEAPTWSSNGTATLRWSPFTIRSGHVELRARAWSSRGAVIEQATVEADIAGPLDALVASGTLHARRARVDRVRLTNVEVPFVVTSTRAAAGTIEARWQPRELRARTLAARWGTREVSALNVATTAVPWGATLRLGEQPRFEVTQRRPWRVAVKRARVAGAFLNEASIVLHLGRGITTASLRWRDAQLGAIALGGGEVGLVRSGAGAVITRGAVRAYGGEVALARKTRLDAPLALTVSGVELDRLLSRFSAHVQGAGRLDGSILVRAGEVERIALVSRSGTLQIGDRRWVRQAAARIASGRVAVAERVGGALADFEYRKLAIQLAPSVSGPMVRIELDGHGRRVAQEVDLIVNVRGLRDAARVLGRIQEST